MRNAKQAKDVWAKIVAEVDAGESPGAVATRHRVCEGTLRWWRSRLKNGANSHRQEAHGTSARLFAVEALVCVYCAGKLRLVEIATEAAALKRIIRDEGRRQGEPVSEMEARGPPRGPPGQIVFAFR